MTVATMHPAVLLGAYGLDHDRMPADEFQIRMGQANAIMDANGWHALFVYGDAMEHRALAWLTNFIPRMRWTIAMLPREGEPRLLVSIGARDIPAMRQMTWIGDVHSGWGWAEIFDPWLREFLDRADGLPVRVGMLGQDLMRSPFVETLRASIGDSVALEPADTAFESLLSVRRPREMAMIREACSLVDAASRAMESAWRGGADAMASALAGERAARAMAAHDVRVLFSVDGGRTLLPFYGVVEGRADPMVAYIAVKYMGYWVDAFVSISDRPTEALVQARQALDAMLTVARPGVTADALIAAAHIDGLSAHPVLGGSVGQPIGLSLSEQPELRANTAVILEPGRVYSLRVGAADDSAGSALLSAIIHVGEDGVEILRRSDRS